MSVSREKLYEQIWSEPIRKVSENYGVSDSYLVRILKKLNIPRPPKGYWAMKAVGIEAEKSKLPAPNPGDPITWSRDGETEYAPESAAQPKTYKTRSKLLTHGLIKEAREHFSNVRESHGEYLKPYKKLCIDLIVSKEGLERGLEVSNNLYCALHQLGHRVQIAPDHRDTHMLDVDERENPKSTNHYSNIWRPYRPTITKIDDVSIGLTIYEMSEEVEVGYLNGKYVPIKEYLKSSLAKIRSPFSWTTTKEIPSGRFCIQVYSTYLGNKWVKQWRETKKGEFSKTMKPILEELCNSTNEIKNLITRAKDEAAERKRLWDEQRERDRIASEERRIAKNLKDSSDELNQIIESWGKLKHIEEFFKEVELRTNKLADDERMVVLARLNKARALIGPLDAFEHLQKWKSPEER
ncbi:hypothetical protein [Methylophilus medardicus]|uniref:Uncharacterized protein n=1 Tax=Methylophilus medardicus TaxID=2588534 RepID=A0A5B8CTD0_9PROT|nr:hypothetical protein [Methylophilus medardicus]QDC44582.1 hypothetical protein FIU01_08600 [Methylophilus medardicus]QDC49589.1 hypothetical protein FIU00_08600 [Methylophilus medardicus]QDC53294.1 hypothetical protein FIT99_08600 [Methylophilus medardicus]